MLADQPISLRCSGVPITSLGARVLTRAGAALKRVDHHLDILLPFGSTFLTANPDRYTHPGCRLACWADPDPSASPDYVRGSSSGFHLVEQDEAILVGFLWILWPRWCLLVQSLPAVASKTQWPKNADGKPCRLLPRGPCLLLRPAGLALPFTPQWSSFASLGGWLVRGTCALS